MIDVHDLIRQASALSTEDVDVPQPIRSASEDTGAGNITGEATGDYGISITQAQREETEAGHIAPQTHGSEPFRFAHLRRPESIEAEFAEFRGTVEHPARGRETQGQQPTGIAHEFALELQPALRRIYDQLSEEMHAAIDFEALMEDRRRTV